MPQPEIEDDGETTTNWEQRGYFVFF